MSSNCPDSIAREYFERVCDAFGNAERAARGRITRQYRVGGNDIQLNFAGPALARLISPAFEHLAAPGESPAALEVLLWDGESTGTEMPAPPWEVGNFISKGEMWRFRNQRFSMTQNPRNSTYDLIDMDRKLAIHYAGTTSRLPQYESGSPLLQILEWWFDTHGEYILHAGAVGRAQGGVLLVGKGGSGKSTTALACLDSDLLYVSDDYCLLRNLETPYASSIYNSAKVHWSEIDRFPVLNETHDAHKFADSDKALCFLFHGQAGKLLQGFPIQAVLIPQVTGRNDTELVKATPAQALLALAPSTIFHFPGTENRAIRRMGQLVKQVPCFILRLGTDPAGIADTIRRALR